MSETETNKRAGGRPAKFPEPSRPVTVTLPERTLRDLERIGPDRGSAIVKLVEAAVPKAKGPERVEVIRVGADVGMIAVGPSSALRKIPFLRMVEITPGCNLLALEPGHDFRLLELGLRDLLEEIEAAEEKDEAERNLIIRLQREIKRLRKLDRLSMAEVLFVRMSWAAAFVI